MHSIFNKLPSSLRLSNVVGKGMPERIRSMGFAFLGLTAAAGLALVAIFAQMGFQLLSPVPLPGGPSGQSSVSRAVPVEQGAVAADLAQAQAQGAVGAPGDSGGQGSAGDATRDGRGARIDRSTAPVSDSPAGSEPVTASPPAAAPEPAPEPVPAPTTTTTTESDPPDEVPVSSPGTGAKPDKSTTVDPEPGKPEAKPVAVKPSKPEAKPVKAKPAKTKAAAKTAKEAKPEATPAPAASYVPAPEAAAVDEGKDKEKEEKKDK